MGAFNTVTRELNGVVQSYIVYVRTPRNVTGNERQDQEEPVLAYIRMLTKQVRLQIFIKIVNVIGHQFQGQIL